MPPRAKRPCRHRGCTAVTNDVGGYCEIHRQQHAGDGWRNYQPGKTRQERGYGRPWEIKRARIMKRDKYLCQNCRRDGIATKASSVDHIIPKAHGGIGTDNQTTLPGGLSAGGNIDNTSKGKVLTQAIELSMSTPYIDFHYNGSSADYTARLIHDRQNRLNAQVQSFWVTDGRITASSTMPANPAIGTQLTSNPVRSLMAGRGAYGDVDGAYVQMYMEEQVGTEHRLVLYADGFGRTDAWIFRAGGTISTGKGDVLTTGSDVRLKDAFMEPQEGACRRINSLGVCEFNMKGETRRRRGFIAQQAEKVDDLYTFLGIEQEIDGEKFRVMNVDYTAIIADLVTVVQDLIRRVDALES